LVQEHAKLRSEPIGVLPYCGGTGGIIQDGSGNGNRVCDVVGIEAEIVE
jgi:hypothetical protein